MIDVRLAYKTRQGLAHYVGGSGLAGEPRYTLAGRVWPHSAIVALAGVRRQRGRICPPREEHRMSEEIAAADSLLRTNADLRSEIARLQSEIVKAEAGVLALLKMNEASLRSYCGRCGSCHRCIRELPILTATHPGVEFLAMVARLQTALAWYADVSHYDDQFAPGVVDPQDGTWHIDCGSRARAALKEETR